MANNSIYLGLIASAAVAAVLFTGAAFAPGRAARGLGTLAVGLAYAAGHGFISRPRGAASAGGASWGFPPLDAQDWLVYLAMAITLLALIEALWNTPLWLTWSVRMVSVAALIGLVLRPFYLNQWDYQQSGFWTNVLALLSLGAWASNEALAQRLTGRVQSGIGLLTTGGTAATLLFSSSAKLALLAACICGVCAVALAVTLFVPRLNLARGPAGVLTALTLGLLLAGYFYGELPAWAALLLAAAPSAAWIGESGRLRAWSPANRAAARMASVLLVLIPPVAVSAAWYLSTSREAASEFARAIHTYGYEDAAACPALERRPFEAVMMNACFIARPKSWESRTSTWPWVTRNAFEIASTSGFSGSTTTIRESSTSSSWVSRRWRASEITWRFRLFSDENQGAETTTSQVPGASSRLNRPKSLNSPRFCASSFSAEMILSRVV